jgi:hypothetical protein
MGACATLRALPSLHAHLGIVAASGVSGFSLQSIVLDGNRAAARDATKAACSSGKDNQYGLNAGFMGCNGCSFLNSVSMNAVCGSGLQWSGRDAKVMGSAFLNNGDHFTQNMWSDGLTLNVGTAAQVVGNTFVDNSDVNLICGLSSFLQFFSSSFFFSFFFLAFFSSSPVKISNNRVNM